MLEQLFTIIHKFPRLFALIGVKHVQPDEVDHRDDVMGVAERLPWEKLKQPNENWVDDFLLTDLEIQKWMDCTGHSLKSILQVLYLTKYGVKISISAAYINGMAGTGRWRGNSMRTVLESVRKNGWVTDDEWSEENRWKTIPQHVIDKGKARCGNEDAEFIFGYDKVSSDRKAMDEAIDFSILYVGGSAWAKRNSLYYSFGGANHCFNKIKKITDTPQQAGDSYVPHVKNLDDNFKFSYVRRIYLGKRFENKYVKLLSEGTKYLITPEDHHKFYKVTKDGLVYIATREEIAKEIANDTDLDKNLLDLIPQKKVMFVPNDWYNKLIK